MPPPLSSACILTSGVPPSCTARHLPAPASLARLVPSAIPGEARSAAPPALRDVHAPATPTPPALDTMLAARRIPSALPRLTRAPAAAFHASARAFVRVGDAVPDVELMEASPGNKISIAKELKGKGLIIGVPAAYSPACSSSHVPGYISHPKLANAGQVFVVSVNDPFVMKAWGDVLDPAGKSGIRFIADPAGAFTKALDLSFDSRAIFGNERSKRYALVVEDGKVKEAHVEPDKTGVNVSAADKVLG